MPALSLRLASVMPSPLADLSVLVLALACRLGAMLPLLSVLMWMLGLVSLLAAASPSVALRV